MRWTTPVEQEARGMKEHLWDLPKFSALAERLGSRALAAGVLESVWFLAGRHDAEEGQLPFATETLREFMGIEMPGDVIVSALVDTGWLTPAGNHWRATDWKQVRSEQVAERVKKRRYRAKVATPPQPTVPRGARAVSAPARAPAAPVRPTSPSVTPEQMDDVQVQLQQMQVAWNRVADQYPLQMRACRMLPHDWIARLHDAIGECHEFVSLWRQALATLPLERSINGWHPTFDWTLSVANVAKLLDGRYQQPAAGRRTRSLEEMCR